VPRITPVGLSTSAAAENSLLPALASVAVATSWLLPAVRPLPSRLPLKLPLASVTSAPSQRRAWALPLLLSASNTSTRAPANSDCPGALPTWPRIVSVPPLSVACVNTGLSIRRLGWPLVSAPSLALAPLAPPCSRSMPRALKPQIRLPSTATPLASLDGEPRICTPMATVLPRTRLPSPLPVPPKRVPLPSMKMPCPTASAVLRALSVPKLLPCTLLPVAALGPMYRPPTTALPWPGPLPPMRLERAPLRTTAKSLLLPSGALPAAPRPIRLPWTTCPLPPSSTSWRCALPAITLPAPAALPPIVTAPAVPSTITPWSLDSAPVPAAFRPIQLPSSCVPVAPLPSTSTPRRRLPPTRLRAAVAVPPTTVAAAPSILIPACTLLLPVLLASAPLPAALTPMWLPSRALPLAPGARYRPLSTLAAIRLRSARVVPPTMLEAARSSMP
jgi:hypothetical protein